MAVTSEDLEGVHCGYVVKLGSSTAFGVLVRLERKGLRLWRLKGGPHDPNPQQRLDARVARRKRRRKQIAEGST